MRLQADETAPQRPESMVARTGRAGMLLIGLARMGLLGLARPVVGVVAALLVSSLFILLTDVPPLTVASELWQGALGSPRDAATSANRATPLLIAGIGVAVALRAGAFNMGVEGQIALGGLTAAFFGLWTDGLPSWIAIPLLLALAALSGLLWSGLAAALCIWRSVNVVIVTLLMNFIALLLVSSVVTGPLRVMGEGFPATPPLPESVHLPILMPQTSLHAGLVVGLAVAIVTWWLLWHTGFGYRLRIAGTSPDAARYLGLRPTTGFVVGMVISGGLAGVAGAVEVLGVRYRLIEGFSQNLGWDSIAVALLGGTHPLGVVPAALFFGALRAATGAVQRRTGIPASLATIVQGLTILFVVVMAVWQFKRRRARHADH